MSEKLVKIGPSDDDDEETQIEEASSRQASASAFADTDTEQQITKDTTKAAMTIAPDSGLSGKDTIMGDLENGGVILSVSSGAMDEMHDEASCQQQQHQEQQYKLSPMRWSILFGFCVVGFCNGLTNEINSILHVYVSVLDISVTNYVYYSQMTFFVPIVASFMAATIVGKFGARTAIFMCVAFVAVRNSARALLFSPHVELWEEFRFVYWIAGVVFMQLSVGIYYCLPMRLAESWFAERERSLALTLFIVTPILGCATAALIYPHYIIDASTAHPLAWINVVTALISIAVVAVCVHRSRPKEGAPSARSQKNLNELNEQAANSETLTTKIKRIVTHHNYLIHAMVVGSFDTLMSTIQSILQDLFANAGLSQVFCGQFLSLSIILAAIIQIGGSILLKPSKSKPTSSSVDSLESSSSSSSTTSSELYGGDTHKKVDDFQDPYRTRVCKTMLALQCLTFVVFAHTLILHELYSYQWLLDAQWWLIIVTSVVYTVIRYSAAPYYNEQLTELICGKISEPVSSAVQMVFTNVFINIFAIIFVSLRQTVHHHVMHDEASTMVLEDETMVHPHHQTAIYKNSVLFVSGGAIFATSIYLIWFNPNEQSRPLVRPSSIATIARPSVLSTVAVVDATKTSTARKTRTAPK